MIGRQIYRTGLKIYRTVFRFAALIFWKRFFCHSRPIVCTMNAHGVFCLVEGWKRDQFYAPKIQFSSQKCGFEEKTNINEKCDWFFFCCGEKCYHFKRNRRRENFIRKSFVAKCVQFYTNSVKLYRHFLLITHYLYKVFDIFMKMNIFSRKYPAKKGTNCQIYNGKKKPFKMNTKCAKCRKMTINSRKLLQIGKWRKMSPDIAR